MKRVLIIGSHSYLGTALASYLSQWPEEYHAESLSVRDETWKNVSFQGFDAVYHTAALVHQEQAKSDPAQKEAYLQINARLPVEVAKKAKEAGVPQFIFLSTMAVYGLTAPFGKTVTVTKDTPLAPKDLYGLSKAQAEEALEAARAEAEGLALKEKAMGPNMLRAKAFENMLNNAKVYLPSGKDAEGNMSVLGILNLDKEPAK